MATYQRVRLSELIFQNAVPEKITDMRNEHYITVSLYGKGVRERVIKDDKYPVPFIGYRVSEGQFIYSRIDARNGAYGIIGPELDGFVVSKDFPVYDINTSRVLPQFLLRSVLGESFLRQVKNSSFGATNRMRIKEEILENYSIFLPPIEEQARITKLIDAVQSILEFHQCQLYTLDALIKARFVEMFGDVETNPKGWTKDYLRNHATVIVGYPFPSEGYSSEGINIIGGYNLMQGYILWEESKHWPADKGFESYLLHSNDIVMAMDRPWVNGGFKIARIDASHLPAILIQRTACIRGKDLEQEFLYYLLDSRRFAEHCNITGSLVPHISNKDINSYQIIIPPRDLQKQFVAFASRVDKSKVAVQAALDKAQLLFDSLMQQYFG